MSRKEIHLRLQLRQLLARMIESDRPANYRASTRIYFDIER
jgi:hypothetical protein